MDYLRQHNVQAKKHELQLQHIKRSYQKPVNVVDVHRDPIAKPIQQKPVVQRLASAPVTPKKTKNRQKFVSHNNKLSTASFSAGHKNSFAQQTSTKTTHNSNKKNTSLPPSSAAAA